MSGTRQSTHLRQSGFAPLPSSFRDPAGYVYREDGVLLRHVTPVGAPDYDAFIASGLYDSLAKRGWITPHEEVTPTHGAHRTLRPEVVPYVSYPYEWTFSQLRAAALLTLDIQLHALRHDLTLKDASAYNVQFVGRRPVFIDTLSFARYENGTPWVAYRQFCQHFLGPLALMAHRDARLGQLAARHLDGLPLDLVTALLPRRTLLKYGLFAHLHLHARSQARHHDVARQKATVAQPKIPRGRLVALLHSLRSAVTGCVLPSRRTEWSHYYEDTNYSSEALAAKEARVRDLVRQVGPGIVHDVGGNTGRFSRVIASDGRYVVSHDIDIFAVERNVLETAQARQNNVLPLVLDLANPSPAIGLALTERPSALERMQGSTIVALALIHHLAIGQNIPLPRLADLFRTIARDLVIEFVPREDSQVRRMLATREDIFGDYRIETFEAAFGEHFQIVHKEPVPGTARTLFLMRTRYA